MKKLTLVFSILAVTSLNAQTPLPVLRGKIEELRTENIKFCDSMQRILNIVTDKRQVATWGSYQRYIDQYFTYLAFERGSLPTGNSASLNIEEDATQLKFSLARKRESSKPKGPILIATAGVQVKLDEGIGNIFSSSSVTTGTKFFGNFAFLPGGKGYKVKYVSDIITPIDSNTVKVDTPWSEFNRKRQDFHNFYCRQTTLEDPDKYTYMLGCLSKLIQRINTTYDTCQRTALFKEKEELEEKIKKVGFIDKSVGELAKGSADSYNNGLYKIEEEAEPWIHVKFFWFSGGITYGREAFNTYNNKLAISDRFGSKDFDSYGLKLTAHWFKNKFRDINWAGSTYFNLSYEPRRTNSFSDLDVQDQLRIISQGVSGDTTIQVNLSKKAKNITDVSYEVGWQHNFSSNYTAMLGSKKNTGINLNAKLAVSQFSKPIYTTRAGVLLRLLNNEHDPEDKESKAKVNIEIFISFSDMSDVGDTGKSVWQNKVIGLSTTLPFSKIFFK